MLMAKGTYDRLAAYKRTFFSSACGERLPPDRSWSQIEPTIRKLLSEPGYERMQGQRVPAELAPLENLWGDPENYNNVRFKEETQLRCKKWAAQIQRDYGAEVSFQPGLVFPGWIAAFEAAARSVTYSEGQAVTK
jgi:hypothetical protein